VRRRAQGDRNEFGWVRRESVCDKAMACRYASDRLCMRYPFAVYASRERSGRVRMFRLRLEDYGVRQRHASECLSLSPEADFTEISK
jgi:hypothetical protein